MDRFDAQTLVGSTPKDQTFEMVFENAQGQHFTVSLPNHVALALIPILSELPKTTKSVGSFQRNVEIWRTGHDNEEPNVLLEINHGIAYSFPVADAKKLWRELREECEKVQRRPRRSH